MTLEEVLNKTVCFKDCQVVSYEAGKLAITTKVDKSDTNPYGIAHGGYLYTLCDDLAGLTAYSLGDLAVTMQSSINYLRPCREGDVLEFKSEALHDGKTSKVVEVTACSKDKVICKASFTLYCTGKAEQIGQ